MSNTKEHFVPQMLIRQFTNNDGRIFCFDKKNCRIPDRVYGNSPRDIMYIKGYYDDPKGNLDAELYKEIENRFAPHLTRLIENPWNASQEKGFGRSLLDWMAAQISRTDLIPLSLKAILRKYNEEEKWSPEEFAVKVRELRIKQFHFFLRLMSLPKWKWKLWVSDDERKFVLSDHPVVNTTTDTAMGLMIFFPFSPFQILVGGSMEGHRIIEEREILLAINGYIFSWSHRFTYSVCLPELESIQHMYHTTGDIEHDNWMLYAREPYHGIARKIMEVDPPYDYNNDFILNSFL